MHSHKTYSLSLTMDQYFLYENYNVFLSDHEITENNSVKNGEFTIDFSKPINFNRKMECSLVQLTCPKIFHPSPHYGKRMRVELEIKFTEFEEDAYETYGFNRWKQVPFENFIHFEYDVDLEFFTAKAMVDKLKEISELINFDVKYYFNVKYFWLNSGGDTDKLEPDSQENVENRPVYKSTGFPGLSKPIQTAKLHFTPFEIFYQLDPPAVLKNLANIRIENMSGDKRQFICETVVKFNKPLHDILGLEENLFPISHWVDMPISTTYSQKNYATTVDKKSGIHELKINEIDVNEKPELLFVYTDIICESYIGDRKANLLNIVPIDKNPNEDKLQTIQIDNPLYIPLRIEEIFSITISIRDQLGRSLKYMKGYITALLKLRPIEHI